MACCEPHLKVVCADARQLAGVVGEAEAVAAGAHDAVREVFAGPALTVAPCRSQHLLEVLSAGMVHRAAGRPCCRHEDACMQQARPFTC